MNVNSILNSSAAVKKGMTHTAGGPISHVPGRAFAKQEAYNYIDPGHGVNGKQVFKYGAMLNNQMTKEILGLMGEGATKIGRSESSYARGLIEREAASGTRKSGMYQRVADKLLQRRKTPPVDRTAAQKAQQIPLSKVRSANQANIHTREFRSSTENSKFSSADYSNPMGKIWSGLSNPERAALVGGASAFALVGGNMAYNSIAGSKRSPFGSAFTSAALVGGVLTTAGYGGRALRARGASIMRDAIKMKRVKGSAITEKAQMLMHKGISNKSLGRNMMKYGGRDMKSIGKVAGYAGAATLGLGYGRRALGGN